MSGGGSQTSTSSTKVEYSPEEAAARKFVWDQATGIYNQSQNATQNGGSPVPGVAGQSYDTIAAQNLARNWAYGGASQIAGQLPGAIDYGLNGARDVNNNPTLQGAIQAAIRPNTENLNENILPGIRTQSVSDGGYGGTRAGIAEGLAIAKANQANVDAAANITSDAYKTGQDTFARTLAFLPQASSVGSQPSQILSGVGAQNENYNQEVLNYIANLNNYNNNKGWGPIGNLASAIYGGIQPGTVTTQQGPSGGGARGALGGAAGGAAAGSAFGPWGTAIGGGLGGILGMFG